MSKIALTPNASGTGVFTISSPATNTDRSLTLPDEAGTVLTSASSLASDNLTGTVTVSGGNVGIGTSSPSDALSVLTSADNGDDSSYTQAEISFGNTAYPVTIGSYRYGGSYLNGIDFYYNNGSPQLGMRIHASGHLLVGKSSVGSSFIGSELNAAGYVVTSCVSDFCGYFNRTTTDGGILQFRKDNAAVGSISITASSTAYNTSSDYRLKTDAQPMVGATDRLKQLNPVNFEWISDGSRVDGFLAHEAQEIVPECVTGTKDAMRDEEYEVTAAVEATYDEDGNELTAAVPAVMGTRSVPDYQGIDQSKLVPLLTAALQEALNKIEAMETRLAALEAV